MGNRTDAVVGTETLLLYQFLLNGTPLEPHDFIKVRIYANRSDAENDENHIEEITSFTSLDTGRVSYIAAAINTSGIYFDRIFITPASGDPTWDPEQDYHINPFYVRKEQYGGYAPGAIEKCRIVFYMKDIFTEAAKEDKPIIKMNREWAWYGKQQIRRIDHAPLDQDDEGMYVFELIETTTLTTDTSADEGKAVTIYYILKAGRFEYKFTIPKGTLDAHVKDLPEYVG